MIDRAAPGERERERDQHEPGEGELLHGMQVSQPKPCEVVLCSSDGFWVAIEALDERILRVVTLKDKTT